MGSSTAVRVLKVVAWVALVGGVLGGIALIVASQSATEIDPNTFELIEGGTNPAGVAVGFFVMLQGVIAWAGLMAFAQVADGVADIDHNIREMRREAQLARPSTRPAPPETS